MPEQTPESIPPTPGPLRSDSMRKLAGNDSPATRSASATPPPVPTVVQATQSVFEIGESKSNSA